MLIPLLAIFIGGPIILFLWRRTPWLIGKAAIVFGTSGTIFAFAWFLGGEKWFYDEEVRRLCAIDGGTRVYETVVLNETAFDGNGSPKFLFEDSVMSSVPSAGDTQISERFLGWQYISRLERTYLKQGYVSVVRTHSKIIRRQDEKILGDHVYYSRSGGDIPGPWESVHFYCPKNAPDLMTSVFIKKGALGELTKQGNQHQSP